MHKTRKMIGEKDLKEFFGGKAKLKSFNPFDLGTVSFEGRSHKKGGIDINYFGNQVEVEGKELGALRANGNFTVFGNLNVPGLNKKFKSVMNDISDQENKYDKLFSSSIDKLNKIIPYKSISDRINYNSHYLNALGSKQKLQSLAISKQNLANLQQSILDTAKENKLDPYKLSKGIISPLKSKQDESTRKFGGNLPGFPGYVSRTGSSVSVSFDDSNNYRRRRKKIAEEGEDLPPIQERLDIGPVTEEDFPLQYVPSSVKPLFTPVSSQTDTSTFGTKPSFIPYQGKLGFLDILPEVYAFSKNAVEYPEARTYQPQQYIPYQYSYQPLVNENISTFNTLAQLMRNNPSVLSNLAARKYDADARAFAQMFSQNQSQFNKVANANIDALNRAQLENLKIFDTQQVRASQARSNTKMTDEAILSSIASKILQRELEAKQIALLPQMTNYGVNAQGQLQFLPQNAVYPSIPVPEGPSSVPANSLQEQMSQIQMLPYLSKSQSSFFKNLFKLNNPSKLTYRRIR